MNYELVWHGFHNKLVAVVDIKLRWREIKRKPKEEQELRSHLFKRVKGPLPESLDKARVTLDKAWITSEKALLENKDAIEALHKKECPDCTWDGTTIFPGVKK